MGMNFRLGTRWWWKAWLGHRNQHRIVSIVWIVEYVCKCKQYTLSNQNMQLAITGTSTWIGVLYSIMSYCIILHRIVSHCIASYHPASYRYLLSELQAQHQMWLPIWPKWSGSLWGGWWYRAGWWMGGRGFRDKSLTAASFHQAQPQWDRSRGVFGLQAPYICTCFVREKKMVTNAIRVSFTSCSRSMLSTELALHHRSSAVVLEMLWAQCNKWLNSFTCFLSPPPSSPSLLLVYSSLKSPWPLPTIICCSHVKY